MLDKKLIIFDFDGTIADTMELGLGIANLLASKYGYRKVAKEELLAYRNLSTRDALKSVGISFLKLPFIARDFRRELHKRIELLKPIDGISQVITQLHLNNCVIGILTSNSTKNVTSFLEKNSMLEMFHFIHPQKNLFNKSKTLKSIVKNYQFQSYEVLYIADETRDIDAAKVSNIPIASVCWGLNTKKALMKHKPDYLIESPSMLLDIVSQELC